jgi:hypothetical protein
MYSPFQEFISIFGALAISIVVSIMALSLFFKGLSWLARKNAEALPIAMRGVLGKNTFAAVHMVGGQSFDRVRLIGFTTSDMKTRVPYELNGMLILEDEKQQRYFVRAKHIKMIVVAPETA